MNSPFAVSEISFCRFLAEISGGLPHLPSISSVSKRCRSASSTSKRTWSVTQSHSLSLRSPSLVGELGSLYWLTQLLKQLSKPGQAPTQFVPLEFQILFLRWLKSTQCWTSGTQLESKKFFLGSKQPIPLPSSSWPLASVQTGLSSERELWCSWGR